MRAFILMQILLCALILTYGAETETDAASDLNVAETNRINTNVKPLPTESSVQFKSTSYDTIYVAEGVSVNPKTIQNGSEQQISKPFSNVTDSNIVNATSSTTSTTTTTTPKITTTTTTKAPGREEKFIINPVFKPLKDANKTSTTTITSTTTTTTTTEKIIPVSETEFGIDNLEQHKKTVGKKGVDFNETSKSEPSSSTTTTTTTTTSTTQRPKKPTVTIGSDEIPNSGKNSTQTNININIDISSENTDKTDYIVPIVGVILSVPLVAILLNLIYRKTKDWWQYRHYRRMDLIDGIYNN